MELKLAKLPDRTPVRMTIMISPDLNKALCQYTDEYNRAYGNTKPESAHELVPYILQSFLESDRAFTRAQKLRERENESSRANTSGRTSRRTRGPETQRNGGQQNANT